MAALSQPLKQTGKNKLNPSTIINNKTVNYKTGSLEAIYSSALKATDYIQVSKNGLVCNHAAPGPGVTNIGYAVYDSDKNYIRGVSAPSNTYIYQEGDAYIRFSLAAGYTQYMVEEGNVVTEYEPYVETSVIDPEVLPKSSLSEEDINIIKGELSSSGIYTNKLEMLLPQLQDEYEQVFVCSFHFDKCKYERVVNQVEQIEMRQTFSPLKIISQVKTIRKLIRKHHPDIVYCHSSFAGGLGRLACLGLRCKVVYNPHGWAFNMK